jgi:hypothetical protein
MQPVIYWQGPLIRTASHDNAPIRYGIPEKAITRTKQNFWTYLLTYFLLF